MRLCEYSNIIIKNNFYVKMTMYDGPDDIIIIANKIQNYELDM